MFTFKFYLTSIFMLQIFTAVMDDVSLLYLDLNLFYYFRWVGDQDPAPPTPRRGRGRGRRTVRRKGVGRRREGKGMARRRKGKGVWRKAEESD